MKKYRAFACLFFLLTTNALATTLNSVVPLPGGGAVSANTSLNLSLNGLTPSARYSVVCYLDTIYPFQYVFLSSSIADNTSTVFSYSINGNYLRQDQLIAGHNIVVIDGQFTTPSTANLVFTNLDQTHSFDVNNCFAIPVTA